MRQLTVKAEDVAMIIDGILYGDSTGYEEVLEQGYNELEMFSEALKESDQVFVMWVAGEDDYK